ncbi:MAG: hypothetical protein ACTHKQ_02295 [Mesorhizobium sp.]
MAAEIPERISLKIDLSTGMIEIDSPAEKFQSAVDKAKELLGQIPSSPPQLAREPAVASDSKSTSTPGEAQRVKNRSVRTSGGSQGRTGRLGSFEPVEMGLDESQERELRSFMQTKNPSEQAEQVAAALYKGEQLTGRKGFGYNEIYSLLRLAGIRDLPKALDVIIGKMIDIQWVVRDGPQMFALKFVGRDYVEHKLGTKE